MNANKRHKLEEPVYIDEPFRYECAICGAWVFDSDNYCPNCGENISGLIGVVTLRDVKEETK